MATPASVASWWIETTMACPFHLQRLPQPTTVYTLLQHSDRVAHLVQLGNQRRPIQPVPLFIRTRMHLPCLSAAGADFGNGGLGRGNALGNEGDLLARSRQLIHREKHQARNPGVLGIVDALPFIVVGVIVGM